jgi:hypothetical protein
VLFVGAVIAIHFDPGSNYLPTQAGIVATYKQIAKDQPGELVYVFDKPYSADFYTGGTAKLASSIGDMDKALMTQHPYFVIAIDAYQRLPADMKRRVTIVVQRNDNILLRPRDPVPSVR